MKRDNRGVQYVQHEKRWPPAPRGGENRKERRGLRPPPNAGKEEHASSIPGREGSRRRTPSLGGGLGSKKTEGEGYYQAKKERAW